MKTQIKISCILFLLLILCFFNLYWLSALIVLIVLFYLSTKYLTTFIKNSFIKSILNALFYILMIVTISVSVRVFMIDIYLIPSSSMENTLYTNDVILVNKLKYGPKLPESPYEVPFLNIFYYLKDNSKKAIRKKSWIPQRLSGTNSIKKGDVIVFKNKQVLVKRCMAAAGDTLKIIDSEVYINDQFYKSSKNVRNTYRFKINDQNTFYAKIDSLQILITIYSPNSKDNWINSELSYVDRDKLYNLSCIDSLQLATTTFPINSKKFPWYMDKLWTLDNYGEIIIPKKGMIIELTGDTFQLYKHILKKHEHLNIKKKGNQFFIEHKLITSIVFKQNYYFMMGDNRKHSFDSRYLGLIPEENIIGKVQCILFSNKDNHFNWDRLFKTI